MMRADPDIIMVGEIRDRETAQIADRGGAHRPPRPLDAAHQRRAHADPRIPIYIAGVNEGLARLAGEACDGFHVHPFHSVKYINDIVRPQIAAGAERAGRPAG